MNTSIRSAFFVVSAIASLASPLAATASPKDFVASYPSAPTQSGHSTSQDYIDSLSGKPFVASKRTVGSGSASQEGNAYIESFSTRAKHSETDAGRVSKMGDGFTRPSTLIR